MTIDAIESNGSNWIELLHSPNYSSAAEQREIKSLMEGAVGRQHAHKLHAIHLIVDEWMRSVLLMSIFGLLFYKSIKHTYLDFICLFEYNLNMFTKENFKSTLTNSKFIWIISSFEFHLNNLQRNLHTILSAYNIVFTFSVQLLFPLLSVRCAVITIKPSIEMSFSIINIFFDLLKYFSLYFYIELRIITSSEHCMSMLRRS